MIGKKNHFFCRGSFFSFDSSFTVWLSETFVLKKKQAFFQRFPKFSRRMRKNCAPPPLVSKVVEKWSGCIFKHSEALGRGVSLKKKLLSLLKKGRPLVPSDYKWSLSATLSHLRRKLKQSKMR